MSVILLAVFFLAVLFADFSANFTCREIDSVYIPIRGAGEQRISDCVEITRGYVLTRNCKDAARSDCSDDRPAARRTRLSSCRSIAQIRAQEHHDATGRMDSAEMDMRLRDVRAQT